MPAFLFSQNSSLYFDHWGATNGLLSSKVTAIHQDKNGFIWIGVFEAVQRFDGYEFVDFLYDPSDIEHSLAPEEVMNIASDSAGNIWVAQRDAICRIHSGSNQVTNYSALTRPELPPGIFNNIYFLHVDKKNRIWVGSNAGFWRFFPDRDSACAFMADKARKSLHEHQGLFWLSTSQGIECYNPESEELRRQDNNPAKSAIFNFRGSINRHLIDRKGDHWITAWSHFINGDSIYDPRWFLYTPKSDRPIEITPSEKNSKDLYADLGQALLEDRQGNIWIGSLNMGLFRLNHKTGSWERYTHDPENKNSLSSNKVTALFEDSQGQLWVGTTNGLCILRSCSDHLKRIDPGGPGTKDRPSGFCQFPDGTIMVGSYANGISEFDSDMNFHTTHDITIGMGTLQRIWSLFPLSNEEVLVSSDEGLHLFNRVSQSSELIQILDPIRKTYINHFFRDKDSLIWGAGYSGFIVEIDPREGFVHNYAIEPRLKEKPSNVKQINGSINGLMFLATDGEGICVFDPQKREFLAPLSTVRMANGLLKVGDTLYVTSRKGLFLYNLHSEKKRHFTRKDGLPAQGIESIIRDDLGYIWMTSHGGIARFNPRTGKFANFTREDGLDTDNFVGGSFLKLMDGRMIAGTESDVYLFDPKHLFDCPTPFPIRITDTYLNGERVDLNSELQKNDGFFEVSHSGNHFQFQFVMPTYQCQGLHEYEYMLEGFDREWSVAGADRRVTYSNLPGGKYRFKARANDLRGMKVQSELEIPILVTQPIWKEIWFRISGSLLALGFVVLISFLRIRSVQKSEEQKRLIEEEKYMKAAAELEANKLRRQYAEVREEANQLARKALAAQMNPHFIFNCMNSINRYILENDPIAASRFLTRFSRLIRIALEHSSESHITLETEIELLETYLELESLRLKNKFTYEVDLEPGLDPSSILLPPMLLQPYVENAIWHGITPKKSKGEIQIRFKRIGEDLSCRISDNGVGQIAQDPENGTERGKSLGTSITRRRLELLGPKASVFYERPEAGPEPGTIVNIRIPIQTI